MRITRKINISTLVLFYVLSIKLLHDVSRTVSPQKINKNKTLTSVFKVSESNEFIINFNFLHLIHFIKAYKQFSLKFILLIPN